MATSFRYTGSSYLEVEGVFRHRLYKFSKRTPELVIMAEDVTVMRAYPELIELKRSSQADEWREIKGATSEKRNRSKA